MTSLLDMTSLLNKLWPGFLLVVMLTLVVSCRGSSGSTVQPNSFFADLVVHTDTMLLRHDDVGFGEEQTRATFVLVDITNNGAEDRVITAGGTLANKDGDLVASLQKESLLVPQSKTRTFGLIAQKNLYLPQATLVDARVMASEPVIHEQEIRLTNLKQYDYNGSIVLNAIAVNEASRAGFVNIISAFHDAKGRPVRRPYTSLRIPASGSHPVQFVGPKTATRGVIFVGQYAYP